MKYGLAEIEEGEPAFQLSSLLLYFCQALLGHAVSPLRG